MTGPAVGVSAQAKRPERESPSPEVLQHRVALNILQGMTASLGEAQVAKALAARPTGQRLSSAPASSSRGAVPSSSRAGSAAGDWQQSVHGTLVVRPA